MNRLKELRIDFLLWEINNSRARGDLMEPLWLRNMRDLFEIIDQLKTDEKNKIIEWQGNYIIELKAQLTAVDGIPKKFKEPEASIYQRGWIAGWNGFHDELNDIRGED